ncbi:hypothetical protein SAMN04487897_1464 [Paenibacillus sp. yr247]|nr:hypothetical protein SAMN04487897_1464 [Paenibacillus sp. yr247]
MASAPNGISQEFLHGSPGLAYLIGFVSTNPLYLRRRYRITMLICRGFGLLVVKQRLISKKINQKAKNAAPPPSGGGLHLFYQL